MNHFNRILLIFFLLILGGGVGKAQEVFFSDNLRRIHRVNLSNCASTVFVTLSNRIGVATDITFTPDGNLYALVGTSVYLVNQTTGAATLVLNLPILCNAMVADVFGNIYIASTRLYIYNFSTNILRDAGQLPAQSAGDLTFKNGKLYLAAVNNALIEVNTQNAALSTTYMTLDTGNDPVFGIVSNADQCNALRTYAVTSQGRVYEIDFDNRVINAVCNQNVLQTSLAYGGASLSEFRASALPLAVQNITTQPSSCAASTGQINIVASGGVARLEYSINGGTTFSFNNQFTNLAAGVYPISIRDSLRCRRIDTTVRITAPNSPILDSVLLKPNICGSSGQGEIRVFGRSPQPNIDDVLVSLNGQNFDTISTFRNLFSGNYTLTLRNLANCRVSQTVLVDSIPVPRVVAVDTTNTTCGLVNGQVIVRATNGNKTPLLYSLDSLRFSRDSVFSALPPSIYRIFVKDIYDCPTSASFQIRSSVGIRLDTFFTTNTTCGKPNGQITGTASPRGATPNFRATFSLNNQTPTNVGNFQNLKGGTYVLKAIDANGCVDSATVQVKKSDSLKIVDILINEPDCDKSQGSIFIRVQGGNGALLFSLDEWRFQTDSSFRQLRPDIYKPFVRDTQGCEARTDLFYLGVACLVFAPNAFSPNNDNANDAFTLFGNVGWVEKIESLEIFNRWGDRVFAGQNMELNNTTQGWNGQFGGKDLQPDVFIYQAVVRLRGGKTFLKKGDVTLLR